MPKRPKPKVKSNAGDKRYDGKASSTKRNEIQQTQHANNLTGKATYGEDFHTRWETSKGLRRINRIRQGKTRENWERTHVVKPNSSNTITSTTGPKHRKNVQPKSRDPYDARESYGIQ